MRRAILVLLVLALAPAAYAQTGANTLRIGWAQDPNTLNPFVGQDEEDFNVWSLVWDQLVNLDPQTLEPAPGIAKSWEVSEDGKTVTYRLDPRAKWSDGRPVTSADVKWSLDVLGSKGALFSGYTSNVKRFETPDARTVVLRAKRPDARFVGGLAVPILPKHIWGQVPLERLTGDYKPKLPLVGSGPYVATKFDRGRIVSLRRNPRYRGEAPGYGQIQFIKYGSQDAVERALTLGEVDFVREVSAGGFARLGRQPNVATRRAPTAAYTEMAFNSCRDCPDAKFNPAVQDTTVRQAVAYAIDRRKLQAIATRGTSFLGHGVLPSFYRSFYRQPGQDYPYDPDRARRLLDEAGWTPGEGGVREKDGQRLRFNLYVRSESPFTIQMGKLIAESTKAIGVEFDVQVVSTDKLTDLTLRKVDGKPAPDFDTFIWGWGGDAYDPSFLLSLFTTDAIGDGLSDAFYSNPEYDRLYDEQTAIFDVQERRAIIQRMVDIVQRDLPYLVLSEDPRLQAYRTDRIQAPKPLCPAETGDLICDQTSYLGTTGLRPALAVAGVAGDARTGSTGLGVLIGLGCGLLAGAALMRRRYRGALEPLERPE